MRSQPPPRTKPITPTIIPPPSPPCTYIQFTSNNFATNKTPVGSRNAATSHHPAIAHVMVYIYITISDCDNVWEEHMCAMRHADERNLYACSNMSLIQISEQAPIHRRAGRPLYSRRMRIRISSSFRQRLTNAAERAQQIYRFDSRALENSLSVIYLYGCSKYLMRWCPRTRD